MAISKITARSIANDAITSDKLAAGAVTVSDIPDGEISFDKLSQVNLAIAPEVLEIQVSAPAAGQDVSWLWTWEQSTLPYARRTITNSPEIQVPLYKQGTYTVNNYAAYDLFDSMTQTHTLYFKWIDSAGTDNLVSWATSTGPVSDSHPDINGGAATDVQRISINVPATVTPPTLTAPSVSYSVTNNGSGAYTFSGSAAGDNPNIGPFYRGGTYTFNVSATGHPLYLTTDNGTNFSAGTYFGEFTNGVTGSRTDSGTVTITVPSDAPDTLYYQCGNHSAMRGAITIKDLAVETNVNGNYIIYAMHTQEGHKTPVEIRPIPSLVNQMCLVYDANSGKFVPQDLATYVENTPSFENKIREVAGTAELVVEDGSAVIAKVNVYDDSTYLPLTGNNAGDQAFATDTDILYIWDGSAWQQAGAANTDDLSEGSTNLFYTDARVDTKVTDYLANNQTFIFNDTTTATTILRLGDSTGVAGGPHGFDFHDQAVVGGVGVGLRLYYRTGSETLEVEDINEVTKISFDKSGNIGFDTNSPTATIDMGARTDSVVLPRGTTAQRPANPAAGSFRFNTTLGLTEYYDGAQWNAIESPPIVTAVSPTSFDGTSGTSFTITGSLFQGGSQVYFITNNNTELLANTVTHVSNSEIIATTPRDIAVSEEPIGIKVVNPSGLFSSLEGVIDAGSTPTWTTNAGSLGAITSGYGSTASLTVAATDPEGQTVTYSLSSGSLPGGLSLNGTTGVISGTPSSVSASTTSNFDISASDGINSTSRSFSIITNPVLDGTSQGKAAGSALDIIDNILAAGGSASDYQALEGPLWINPGFAYSNAFEIYCDMNTEGGGWTLCAKYDANQASSSLYSFERGMRGYSNINELAYLKAGGSLTAYIDLRDIINYDRTKSTGGVQYGGRFLMHACCNNSSGGRTREHYTGSTKSFTSSQAGADDVGINGAGGQNINYSPMFSQLHKNIYDGSNTTNLFNTTGSHITNSGGSASATTSQYYDSASDIQTYGGGVFYGLGSSITGAPTEMLNRIDPNAGYDDHTGTSLNGNTVSRQDNADGISMFSCVNREGSVYTSGTNNNNSNTGHNSPKFQWGFYSADGTQQSYGYGNYCIGTHCSNSIGTATTSPRYRMNYMFIR